MRGPYKRLAPIALVVLTVVGTSGSFQFAEVASIPQGAAAQVPPVVQPFYQGPIFPEARLRSVRDALPYESITLERSGGMVIRGGLFRLTLRKDGAATLWTDGSRFGRAGEYVGTVHLFDYAKINHLIAEARIDQLLPRYAVSWTDM